MHWLSLFLFALPAMAESESDHFQVRALSDLNFGQAIQGDMARTIPPGTNENGSNASFLVKGRPFYNYSIIFPQQSIALKSDHHDHAITVNQFVSYPSSTDGLLDGEGQQVFYVGATRSAIPINAKRGDYDGHFLVVVIF